jgi:hypothetical protein
LLHDWGAADRQPNLVLRCESVCSAHDELAAANVDCWCINAAIKRNRNTTLLPLSMAACVLDGLPL